MTMMFLENYNWITFIKQNLYLLIRTETAWAWFPPPDKTGTDINCKLMHWW